MNGMKIGIWILSRYLCAFKLPSVKCHCLLSVALPDHTMPPWGTLFTHRHTLSALCPVQLKPRFIHEEHTSPACQWLLKVRIPNCSQVKTLVSKTSKQVSFPETVSDSLCRNSSVVQTHNLSAVRVAGLRRSWK